MTAQRENAPTWTVIRRSQKLENSRNLRCAVRGEHCLG